MKISTAEEDAKGKIAARIPVNLKTVHQLVKMNRQDWEALEASGRKTRAAVEQLRSMIKARRRKMATLIEELSLRTSKIQPLMKKLRSISAKMAHLQKQLVTADKHPARFDPEDVMVMREELSGLRLRRLTQMLQPDSITSMTKPGRMPARNRSSICTEATTP